MAIWKKQERYIPPIQLNKINFNQISGSYSVPDSTQKEEKEKQEERQKKQEQQKETAKEFETKDERLERFKERLKAFDNVQTLEEAKKILDKTIPIALDRITFYIGNAKCVIVNYEERLRICVKSPQEFIAYDFV